MPAAIEVVVVIVRVDEPAPVMDAGLNAEVAPLGKPLRLRLTTPAKPLRAVVETV